MTQRGTARSNGSGAARWRLKACPRCGRGDLFLNPGEDGWACIQCGHEVAVVGEVALGAGRAIPEERAA